MRYDIAQVDIEAVEGEITALMASQYEEYAANLAKSGVVVGPFNPRRELFRTASREGWLLTWAAMQEGVMVGYLTAFLRTDLYSSEQTAAIDTVYVVPEHRRGIGLRLIKHAVPLLRERGAKRIETATSTDDRVKRVYQRAGFIPTATILYG